MKIRKNAKNSLLATLVCLSLSAGTAWAMPSNPNVVVGGNDVDVSNLADIKVNANGLIDWESFSIAKGETVNFAFGNNASEIINHVTGKTLSEIMGTLSGNGHVTLINPNGITVGGSAVIDVNGLTLSTLDVSDKLLKSYLNGEAGLVLGDANTASTAMIEVKDGAKINFTEMLELYGGKIQIADGVTISNGAQSSITEPRLNLIAANEVTPYRERHNSVEMKANTANTLVIGGPKGEEPNIKLGESQNGANLWGGTVSLNKTVISGNDSIDIVAGNSVKREGAFGATINVEATKDNVVSLSQANISSQIDYTNGVNILGGKVAIEESQITANGGIFAEAGNKITHKVNEETTAFEDAVTLAEGNSLDIDKSQIVNEAYGNIMLNASQIAVKNESKLSNMASKTGSADELGGEIHFGTASINGKLGPVKISNSDINANSSVQLNGSKIDIIDSNIKITGNSFGDDLRIQAFAEKNESDNGGSGYQLKAGKENTVNVSGNSTLEANWGVNIFGGAVALKDSTVKQKNRGLDIVAANDITVSDEGSRTITYAAGNNLTINNSQIIGDKEYDAGISLNANSIKVENKSNIAAGSMNFNADDENASYEGLGEIAISDSTLDASNNIKMYGREVDVEKSKITTKSGLDMEAFATKDDSNKYSTESGAILSKTEATKNNTVKVSGSNLEATDGAITILGGAVALADTPVHGKNGSELLAANEIVTYNDTMHHTSVTKTSLADGNDLTLSNSTISADCGDPFNGGNANISLGGNKVIVEKGSDLTASYNIGINGDWVHTAEGNMGAVKVDGSSLTAGNDVSVSGGTVELVKSPITAKNGIEVGAYSARTTDEEGVINIAATKDNFVNVSGSEFAAGRNVNIHGGAVTVKGSTITANGDKGTAYVDIVAANNIIGTENGDKSFTQAAENALTIDESKITAKAESSHINLRGTDIEVANKSELHTNAPITIGEETSGNIAGNVKVNDSTIESDNDIKMYGADLVVEGSTLSTKKNVLLDGKKDLKITGKSDINAGGDITISANSLLIEDSNVKSGEDIFGRAVASYKHTSSSGKYIDTYEATPANTIVIKNSTISSKEGQEFEGGKIDISDTTFNTYDLNIIAANKYRSEENKNSGTMSTDAVVGNTIRLNNLVQNVPEGAEEEGLIVMGGKIDIEGNFVTPANVALGAGKKLTFRAVDDSADFTTKANEDSALLNIAESAQKSMNQNASNVIKVTVAYDNSGNNPSSDSGNGGNGGNTPAPTPGNGGNGGNGGNTPAPTPGSGGNGGNGGNTPAPAPGNGGNSGNGGSRPAPAPAPATPGVDNPVPATVPPAPQSGSVPQSENAPAPRVAAEMQEVAQAIAAIPAAQEVNRTVHQEVDQAVDAHATAFYPVSGTEANAPIVSVATEAGNTGVTIENSSADALAADKNEEEQK